MATLDELLELTLRLATAANAVVLAVHALKGELEVIPIVGGRKRTGGTGDTH